MTVLEVAILVLATALVGVVVVICIVTWAMVNAVRVLIARLAKPEWSVVETAQQNALLAYERGMEAQRVMGRTAGVPVLNRTPVAVGPRLAAPEDVVVDDETDVPVKVGEN